MPRTKTEKSALVRLTHANGAVVTVSPEKVEGLLAGGLFTEVKGTSQKTGTADSK